MSKGLFACGTLILGALVACSSSSSNDGAAAGAVDDDTSSAASELTTSANSATAGSDTDSVGDGTAPAGDPNYPKCHPHLFARGVDYSRALNFHVDLLLHHVDEALKKAPKTASGSSYTWQRQGADVDLELVVTRTAPGQFTFTVGLAPPGSTSFTTVASGTIDRSNKDDVKKHIALDFDALHKALPAGAKDKSAGQLTLDIERTMSGADAGAGSEKKRTVTYSMTNFVPVYGDAHGPRTGNIYFLREPGVGGAMVYDASAVFFCPANPQGASADTHAIARWFVNGDKISGRADAIASGGQFPAGNRWVGLSCRTGTAGDPDDGYWLMKEEDASGATVKGADVSAVDSASSDPACDPAFGAVTTLDGNANDPTIPDAIPSNAFPGQF